MKRKRPSKRKEVYAVLDIETSGQNLHDVTNMCHLYDLSCNIAIGELVGIGLVFIEYNPNTKERRILQQTKFSMFMPMKKKFNYYHSTIVKGDDGSSSKADIRCSESLEDGVLVAVPGSSGATIFFCGLDGKVDREYRIEPKHISKCTIFESDCFKFWMREKDKLIDLTYTGKAINKKELLCEVIDEILSQTAKWEEYSTVIGANKMRWVSDNGVYDAGLLIRAMEQVYPDKKHLLYTVKGEKWNGGVRCLSTLQDSMMALYNPNWYFAEKGKNENTDHGRRLRFLFGMKDQGTVHNHDPLQDAIHIAHCYLDIRDIVHRNYCVLTERLSVIIEKGS